MTQIRNTESNWKILAICLGTIVGVFAGCKSDATEPEIFDSLTVGITPFIGEAALFVADEEGFFRDEGLDVTLRVNNAGSESIRQLLAGEIEIAHVAETPVLYSIMDPDYFTGEKKGELQILTNMIHTNRIQGAIGRRDAGIGQPQDLRGKRVALAGGTQSEYHLDSFLLEHRIDKQEIDTVHMHALDLVKAISGGEVDAVFVWEPHSTHIRQLLGQNATNLTTRLTYSTLWLATTLDHYVEEHPKILIAYLRALRRAQLHILEEPLKSIELLAKRTETPYEVIFETRGQIDFEFTLSERMLNLLLEQQRWMRERGLNGETDQQILNRIRFSFLEEVYPEGISLIR